MYLYDAVGILTERRYPDREEVDTGQLAASAAIRETGDSGVLRCILRCPLIHGDDPMATVLTSPATETAPQRLVLDDVTWDQYVTISDALTPQRGLRLTFDGTRLEFKTLSYRHENLKTVLGYLIATLAFLDIDLQSGGSMTFRREDALRGFEPDQCYWFQHAREMVGVAQWDPAVHPPPDLAVETDVASSSLNRREIYAGLSIPELWRCDGKTLQASELSDAGQYKLINHSLAFPFLQVAELQRFLHADSPEAETQTIRRFRDWMREQGFRP
ncbi:MAG: Uma2 family endonuclease [Planctomycetota bacterium]|nr:MAG: Uma2 family endonuclease [Planctomycetota bacterium]REK26370.1 MAG: Uma2 family endonuclease [Planctomycetota bacterium]